MASERPLAILVIDDDETSNIEAKAVLAEAGHVAEVLTDPLQIAEIASRQHFDAVFVDLATVGSSGDRWEQIQAAVPDLPLVAMSELAGFGDADDRAGFVAAVQKPLDPDEVAAVVDAVLRRDAIAVPEVTPLRARPTAELTFKQMLFERIYHLPRGRGLVQRWVRRIPGLDLPRESVVVPTVFGTRMWVNPSDNSLEQSVYTRGIYEVPGTSLLLSVLPRVKVFWDIGANVGYQTLLASRVMGAGGQIFAFEPHPRIMSLLRENVTSFGGPNVTLLNMGLSDEDCVQEIFDEGETVGRAPTFVPGIYETSGHRCELRTGDGLIDTPDADGVNIGRPDFIKIDIEGYEARAFKGLEGLLSSPVPPLLLFELNETFNPDSVGLLDFLATCGGYEFSVERHAARYPVARQPADAPVAGFVPLCLDAIPSQCNVLGWRPDVHAGLLAGI